MNQFNRRAFLAASASSVAMLGQLPRAFAQGQCITAPFPQFLPNRLTVDCASRQNFRLFRQNSTYLGLAGVVSMSFVRGKLGSYEAGNLFLFPWLKPKGLALGAGRAWACVAPMNATKIQQAGPIPGATIPQDEYFCRMVLQAPVNVFIGFGVDEAFSAADLRLGYHSNVEGLADGKPVGIMWASSNLNHPWFGGSQKIPNAPTCNGAAWRKLIAEGLQQASVGTC